MVILTLQLLPPLLLQKLLITLTVLRLLMVSLSIHMREEHLLLELLQVLNSITVPTANASTQWLTPSTSLTTLKKISRTCLPLTITTLLWFTIPFTSGETVLLFTSNKIIQLNNYRIIDIATSIFSGITLPRFSPLMPPTTPRQSLDYLSLLSQMFLLTGSALTTIPQAKMKQKMTTIKEVFALERLWSFFLISTSTTEPSISFTLKM